MNTRIREQLVALVPRLRRFAVVLTGSGEEADELVYAAVEKALDAPNDWRSEARVKNRMFSIVRMLRTNQRRARGDRSPTAPTGDTNDTTDGPGCIDGGVHLEAVRSAFSELPEDERSVLFLICSERLTYKVTAEILGVPVKTVAPRLAGARLALYGRLAGSRDDAADNVVRISSV